MVQAPEMADSCMLMPDLVLCSPAVRAWSTAICYFQQLNWEYKRLKITPSLYEASLDTLIFELQNLNESCETLFLFGHNPGFNYLISFLAHSQKIKLNMNGIPNLVTSGRVVIELDILGWHEIGQHCGSIVEWNTPKNDLS